jgi:hypothetical protein
MNVLLFLVIPVLHRLMMTIILFGQFVLSKECVSLIIDVSNQCVSLIIDVSCYMLLCCGL